MSESNMGQVRARAQAMLENCELTNVQLIDIKAERFSAGQPVNALIASNTGYIVNETTFANRFDWEAKLVADDEEVVAEMSATFIVDYDVHEGFEPDAEAGEYIATTTGFFAAYPYVRELFQSTCGRLGLDPLVLGMLLADSTGPRALSNPISRPDDGH